MLQNASFLMKNCESRLAFPFASGGWGLRLLDPHINLVLKSQASAL